ncbi:hypothetical protein B0T26DRAFT_740949 [Lasiosphaeria miniovina]|uniref:Uncharacterized protein n=1 Tax=Lasiosphaeria miniovina TaxID=1954250 RepID=A0AA40DV99_9PEZI|nr:uncharacterized protein B0T26DRAFT_740949 [Lasiosphaeria miniovina]KAK0717664.1 hypothetical protein B0T26DRAFT_740949 [Lasiosphaeria miniovina]
MDSESLVKILRAYDTSLDAASVRVALEDEKARARAKASATSSSSSSSSSSPGGLVDWVALHLTSDTLLSVDELNQFAALEKAGLAAELAATTDLGAVQSFSDQEIKDAIEELNRCTDAISKQTEALKQQQEALDRLVSGTRKAAEARFQIESRQTQKWETQHRSVALAVEDLSQSLHLSVVELEQQGKGDGASLQQTVAGLFQSDDKLLSSLQKLGWELDTEDTEVKNDVVMLRETCARLIKFTVEGIRTKLDRTYLESLEASIRSGTTKHVSADDVSALQDELESLYAEILPVAQMSAEQQFLAPALKKLATENGQSFARSKQAVRYICDCLDYLLDHVQDLSTRVEAFQAYQVAASALINIARSELAAQVPIPAKRERRPTLGASPTRRKSIDQGNPASPVRPGPRSRPRRSSGLGGDGPPLEDILRALAINLSQEDASSCAIGAEAQVKVLASTLAERQAKAKDVAQNVQESFESAAIKQIADAKRAIQMARESVLAESPFGQVRLVDPEIDGSIAVLSQELENARVRLEDIGANLVKVRGKSAKKDDLIKRWGT